MREIKNTSMNEKTKIKKKQAAFKQPLTSPKHRKKELQIRANFWI